MPDTGPDSDAARSRPRWFMPLLMVVAVTVAGAAVWLAWERVDLLVHLEEAGPVPFFTAMALLPAAGVPLTPLFILAGATFGSGPGLVGSGIALAINLTVSYWLATLLRPRLTSLFRRFRFQLPDFEARDDALRFTLAAKFTPGVPGFIKTYGLGIARVPFVTYFVCSLLISGAYGALLVVIGKSLLDHQLDRMVAPALGVLLLALGTSWYLRRRRRSA